jgi:hypothetical protein
VRRTRTASLDAEPDALYDKQVLMTMIGGEVVFCREGSEAVWPRP